MVGVNHAIGALARTSSTSGTQLHSWYPEGLVLEGLVDRWIVATFEDKDVGGSLLKRMNSVNN